MTRDFPQEDYNNHHPQVSAAKALQRIGTPAIVEIPKLVVALKHRRKVPLPFEGREGDLEEYDFSPAAAVAEVLGSFGPKAKAAVPYLIEAVKTQEKDDENSPVRRAAILALGRIGPNAKAAIPVLRNAMKDLGKRLQASTEVLIALHQLDPDGKALDESWLENFGAPAYLGLDSPLKARALLLGVLGRTSLETDWLTGRYLERMDSMFGSIDPREEESIEYIEDWLETLGSFGSAGRLAIPRMKELSKHANPWVRMWLRRPYRRLLPLRGLL